MLLRRPQLRFGAIFLSVAGLFLLEIGSPARARADGLPGPLLEGTWDLTVIGSPFRIVRTFLKGGCNIDSSNFTPITPTPGPLTVSDGHGNWKQTGVGQFAMTLKFFQFDPEHGKLDTIGKVRERIQLGPDGNTYVGIFVTDIYLPNGTAIIHTGGRVEGVRVTTKQ